jgi:hypothetical protein
MIRGRRRGDAARNDEKEGELTDRGLRGGVGRDELAEVLRVVARPASQGASHRRRRCWVLAVISVPSPSPATDPAPFFSPQVVAETESSVCCNLCPTTRSRSYFTTSAHSSRAFCLMGRAKLLGPFVFCKNDAHFGPLDLHQKMSSEFSLQ